MRPVVTVRVRGLLPLAALRARARRHSPGIAPEVARPRIVLPRLTGWGIGGGTGMWRRMRHAVGS
jgi:hypothetical protein